MSFFLLLGYNRTICVFAGKVTEGKKEGRRRKPLVYPEPFEAFLLAVAATCSHTEQWAYIPVLWLWVQAMGVWGDAGFPKHSLPMLLWHILIQRLTLHPVNLFCLHYHDSGIQTKRGLSEYHTTTWLWFHYWWRSSGDKDQPPAILDEVLSLKSALSMALWLCASFCLESILC